MNLLMPVQVTGNTCPVRALKKNVSPCIFPGIGGHVTLV